MTTTGASRPEVLHSTVPALVAWRLYSKPVDVVRLESAQGSREYLEVIIVQTDQDSHFSAKKRFHMFTSFLPEAS